MKIPQIELWESYDDMGVTCYRRVINGKLIRVWDHREDKQNPTFHISIVIETMQLGDSKIFHTETFDEALETIKENVC